jgi:hypothetical protein
LLSGAELLPARGGVYTGRAVSNAGKHSNALPILPIAGYYFGKKQENCKRGTTCPENNGVRISGFFEVCGWLTSAQKAKHLRAFQRLLGKL